MLRRGPQNTDPILVASNHRGAQTPNFQRVWQELSRDRERGEKGKGSLWKVTSAQFRSSLLSEHGDTCLWFGMETIKWDVNVDTPRRPVTRYPPAQKKRIPGKSKPKDMHRKPTQGLIKEFTNKQVTVRFCAESPGSGRGRPEFTPQCLLQPG